MGPCIVPRTMSSTNSATLGTPFKIKGVNYSISSACSTSSHCIGNAYEIIQLGKQKIILPVLPSESVNLKKGNSVRHIQSGAGGYGNPLERDPELVLEDVLEQTA